MINRYLLHPNLRSWSDGELSARMGWWGLLFPHSWRISWYGDCGLYCRPQDYQDLLDAVPCETHMLKGYRACALEGEPLDRWREQVQAWLNQFDILGNRIGGGRSSSASPRPPSRSPQA